MSRRPVPKRGILIGPRPSEPIGLDAPNKSGQVSWFRTEFQMNEETSFNSGGTRAMANKLTLPYALNSFLLGFHVNIADPADCMSTTANHSAKQPYGWQLMGNQYQQYRVLKAHISIQAVANQPINAINPGIALLHNERAAVSVGGLGAPDDRTIHGWIAAQRRKHVAERTVDGSSAVTGNNWKIVKFHVEGMFDAMDFMQTQAEWDAQWADFGSAPAVGQFVSIMTYRGRAVLQPNDTMGFEYYNIRINWQVEMRYRKNVDWLDRTTLLDLRVPQGPEYIGYGGAGAFLGDTSAGDINEGREDDEDDETYDMAEDMGELDVLSDMSASQESALLA